MSQFWSETSKEILIYDFKLYMDLAFFLLPTYSKKFEFLACPKSYNKKFASGDPLKDLTGDLKARPLSQRDIEDSKFWEKYRDIGVTNYPPLKTWDRQEPVRVHLPIQFVPNEGVVSGVTMYSYPPEVFLFPIGWASLLKFSVLGSISNSSLPQLTHQLYCDAWIKEIGSHNKFMNLDDLSNRVRGIIKKHIYKGSERARKGPILDNRIIAILNRENPIPHTHRSDEGDRIICSTLLGREISHYDMLEHSDRFTNPISEQFLKMKYKKSKKKKWMLEGWVYLRFQSGVFLDLPITNTPNQESYREAKRFIQCLATNIRNHIIMVNLLQTLINKAHDILPKSDQQMNEMMSRLTEEEQNRMYDFYQLVTSSKKVLREMLKFNERVGKAYIENNTCVETALKCNLPATEWPPKGNS